MEEEGYTTLEELEYQDNSDNISIVSEKSIQEEKKKKKKTKSRENNQEQQTYNYKLYINTFIVLVLLLINSNPRIIRYIFSNVYEVIPYYYLSGSISVLLTLIYYIINRFLL
jgi:hypothetical protein